jgi:hypothetical protein
MARNWPAVRIQPTAAVGVTMGIVVPLLAAIAVVGASTAVDGVTMKGRVRVVCTVALLVALGDTEVLVVVIEAVGPVVSVKRMTINGQAGGEAVIDETKGVLW